MNDFVNVNKKDPQVRNKINDILDKYNRLLCIYQSKKEYDGLIQNVILKKIKNQIGATIVDIDIESKKKISRIKYLESRL